jgi:plastocyanin
MAAARGRSASAGSVARWTESDDAGLEAWMMANRWVVTAALAAVGVFGLALASCGGSGDSPPVAPPTDPDGVPVIDQDNLKFRPGNVVVPAGQVIRFKNSETAVHNVSIDGKDLSGTMRKGDTFEWTPPGPGTYRMRCDYHPQMRGTITVQ